MDLNINGCIVHFNEKETELIITFAEEKNLSIHDLVMLALLSLDETHFFENR